MTSLLHIIPVVINAVFAALVAVLLTRVQKSVKGLTAILLATALVSCTKEGDVIYLPDPADMAKTSPLVTVVYDPDALGDRSYNDLIYQGVEEAAMKNGLRTLQLSPSSMEEGEDYLESLFSRLSQASDTVRRLIIVTTPAYDAFLRKNSHRLESNKYVDLLYLESDSPLPDKGSTLFLQYYGAMYEAGVIASAFVSHGHVIGANPENKPIHDAIQGFSDGFLADYFKNDTKITTNYIGEKVNEGFVIEDSVAIGMLYKQYSKNRIVVPVCGGASNTFYRMIETFESYNAENRFFYMGIDQEKSSIFCFMSAVKHIDQVVEMCIGQWLSEKGMPKHQTFGLESGYTEMVLKPFTEDVKKELQDNFPEAVSQKIHAEALRKEAEYEK